MPILSGSFRNRESQSLVQREVIPYGKKRLGDEVVVTPTCSAFNGIKGGGRRSSVQGKLRAAR